VIDGAAVRAEMEVLVWSDIVRGSMATGIFATYVQLLRTAWIYISSGALWRLMLLRKGPVIAALYPVVVLLGQLALAVLAGVLASRLVLGLLGLVFTVPGWLGWAVFLGCLLGLGGVVLRWFKARDNGIYAHYLMHDYAYSAQLRASGGVGAGGSDPRRPRA